jgi:hypothetical protein
MSEASHLELRRTPRTHHANHQQDVSRHPIPLFDLLFLLTSTRAPSLIYKADQ